MGMKLLELHKDNTKSVYAWLRPATNDENIMGVELVYIQPLSAHMDWLIYNANKYARKNSKRHGERLQQLKKEKNQHLLKGKRYFTPTIGWWFNEEDFHAGRDGYRKTNKGDLMHRYPNLQIEKNEEVAVRKAKESGLI